MKKYKSYHRYKLSIAQGELILWHILEHIINDDQTQVPDMDAVLLIRSLLGLVN